MPKTHSKSKSLTYKKWDSMLQRCYNPNCPSYKNYGALGITVCESWKASFLAFYEDMGECPKGLTLDRLDSTKPYTKENCRWASIAEQNSNKKIHQERGYSVAGITSIAGIDKEIVYKRLQAGYSIQEALTRKNTDANKNSTSGIRGVSWHKSSNSWQVTIKHKKQCFNLGNFKDITKAVESLNAKRIELGLQPIEYAI